jgi:DNA polymerase III gamma/tau subunit
VHRALEKGIDPARLAGNLLEEIRNLAVARLVDDPSELIDAAPDEVEEIRGRAQAHDPEALDRLFRVLQSRTQELAFAQHPDHVVEMAVVRMATLPASESIADLLRRLEGLGTGPPPEPGGPARPSGGPAGSSGGFGGRTGNAPRPAKGSGRRSGASDQSANPRDQGGEGGATRRTDPEKPSRIRQETKSHPAVRRVIDFFDAELQSIEFPKEES